MIQRLEWRSRRARPNAMLSDRGRDEFFGASHCIFERKTTRETRGDGGGVSAPGPMRGDAAREGSGKLYDGPLDEKKIDRVFPGEMSPFEQDWDSIFVCEPGSGLAHGGQVLN